MSNQQCVDRNPALGSLAASEYFGGEIKSLESMDIPKWTGSGLPNPKTKHPYLACYPEDLPSKILGCITEEGMFEAGRLMPNTFFFTRLQPVLRTRLFDGAIPIMLQESEREVQGRGIYLLWYRFRVHLSMDACLHRFSQPS